jgi:hypothetical protein
MSIPVSVFLGEDGGDGKLLPDAPLALGGVGLEICTVG